MAKFEYSGQRGTAGYYTAAIDWSATHCAECGSDLDERGYCQTCPCPECGVCHDPEAACNVYEAAEGEAPVMTPLPLASCSECGGSHRAQDVCPADVGLLDTGVVESPDAELPAPVCHFCRRADDVRELRYDADLTLAICAHCRLTPPF